MKDFVQLEQTFGSYLEEYLHHTASAPSELKRLASDVNQHVKPVKDVDFEGFLGHPVNSYLLVWRFWEEWRNIVNKLDETNPIGQELRELVKEHNSSFPSLEDLKGCALAILRIQDVYHISAEKIANGTLSDKTLSPELGSAHCLQLGHINHYLENYEEAYGWFTEAWKRLSPLDKSSGIKNKDVLEYLIWAEYKTGRIESALNHTNLMLKEDPNDEEAKQSKVYYESRINVMQEPEYDLEDEDEDEEETEHKPKLKFISHYERLCRGESNKSQAELSKLTCYYHNKHPLLVIKPAKIEIASLKPNIYLLHDIIRDADIEFIKNLAAPRLQRATVTNPDTGNLEFADYRISKSGWIEDKEGEAIKRLNLNLEAITGLATAKAYSEALQVVNYGIAGQYEPHVDHALTNKSAIFKMGMRNRIATVLIYMTDVEAGGSTVFLDAETIVEPQKGTAAFWFNLLKSGESDGTTRHAGCPVIVGTKWVSNKWIHEDGQEFRRPCGLSPDE
ncbi:hypothetical protein OS493_006567 [Desmophyllum pertusum]|uniref:procollagen-proline 4-dioxygenase n=1 Tax=Desmophyllum pertusum TaxID=174260 RepID=A0A9X0DAN5_9CNID|nr:hypothetical protein OS493_006567 [Desmophyllum pertusum]